MINLAFILAILIEIGLPILLGFWFIRRYGTSWRLFFYGALAFLGSQVLHIPFLQLLTNLFSTGVLPAPPPAIQPIFNAVLLGLLAGLFEETARWIVYRLLRGRATSWGGALTLGAGHGGVESIVIGFLVLAGYISYLSGANASAFAGMAWFDPLAGSVERINAILMHLTLSVMVMLAFLRGNGLWYVAAVLWHAAIDAVSAYLFGQGIVSAWALEGILVGFSVTNLILLYWFYQLSKAEVGPDSPIVIVEEPVGDDH